MCLVCIEYAKGKMTPNEALHALNEMLESEEEEHLQEVAKKLLEDWWERWNENIPQTD